MSKADLRGSAAMDPAMVTSLRFVEADDAAFICRLRSDLSLNQHISHGSTDVNAQRAWIETYKDREADGREFYFVIRHQLKDFGLVRMYDFRDNSFCWGSWIVLPDRPDGLVTYSAVMIYELGFDALGFEASHFDVRLSNQKVIDFHLRSGAEAVSRDATDQYFVFSKEKWPRFRTASARQIEAHRVPLE
jgi:Acetyltransferase (GNAT) domain